jgi:hypothetical protein
MRKAVLVREALTADRVLEFIGDQVEVWQVQAAPEKIGTFRQVFVLFTPTGAEFAQIDTWRRRLEPGGEVVFLV